MVGMHVMHSEYWQSYFRFGTSSPCCIESFLCKQAILGKQECCNARPLQVFQRHGHSCCLFRCCPQKSIQTRSLEDGYCVSPVVAFHCWATWWRGLELPWHEILHHWNERVKFFTSRHGLKSWSAVCLGQYWKFAHYVSHLPRERWVVRAMNWFPENARRVGRPAYTWDSMIQHFCRHKQIGNWRERAQNISFWMSQFDDFLSFTDTWWTWNVNSICCACLRPERAACFGMQVSLSLSLSSMHLICVSSRHGPAATTNVSSPKTNSLTGRTQGCLASTSIANLADAAGSSSRLRIG